MSTEDERWSRPVEALLAEKCGGGATPACDVLIVGSGYGGSFAAAELATGGIQVWVMERGREYALGEFAEDLGSLPGHVRFDRKSSATFTGGAQALFDLRMYEGVSVLLGSGLGGGSLINAGVALPPEESSLKQKHWPAEYRADDARRARLFETMTEIAGDVLQAKPLAGGEGLGKYRALAALAPTLGEGRLQLAPITVASDKGQSPSGLDQDRCIRCGNCFTGCNVGAKNTLVSHVIPRAARQGARFFTGATAWSVEPYRGPARLTDAGRPVRWRVAFCRSTVFKGQATKDMFFVEAHTLILSAGTLGSTEILLRSPAVSRSERLGRRFSTNGDVIALGWGMKEVVDGISAPLAEDAQPSREVVGPTIVGSVKTRLKSGTPVLVQEGAIPSALAQAVIALGATLSIGHRYTRDLAPPAYGDQPDKDVLAVPPEIGRHALLLLGMGHDDSDGCMALKPVKGAKAGEQRMQINWDKGAHGGAARYYQEFHELLQQGAKRGGFQGGDYLTNPAWQPFPDGFSAISGEPPHRLVTVHPLGGCAMADNGREGVVDWTGAVFKGATKEVHAGLHVLDGAMIPGALGVNPFLTISALSVTAAREIRKSLGAGVPAGLCPQPRLPAQQPRVAPQPTQPVGPIVLSFEERLLGKTEGKAPAWLDALATRKNDHARGWIARVRIPHLDLHAWLANPGRPHRATLEIFRNRFSHEMTSQDEALRGEPVLKGEGWVSLLAQDAPKDSAGLKQRCRDAIATYLSRRTTRDLTGIGGGDAGVREGIRGYFRAARNMAYQRTLDYDFVLAPPGRPDFKVKAGATKRLAYASGAKNVWDALTELDLTLTPQDTSPPARIDFDVDLVDMVNNGRLQVKQAPNTPVAIVGIASFAALWARAILKTHFWTFRGLSYESFTPQQPARPGLLRPHGLAELATEPATVKLEVPRGHDTKETITIELTSYSPRKHRNGKHLLMIHGLAHGGAVFTTDTVGSNNMATAFLAEGYEVWVLDHRLSNRLPYAGSDHTMDDVADFDIPCAVSHVSRQAAREGSKVHVFAHCVGAGAFAMAVLRGRFTVGGGSMIESAIIHAVHPWVVPSVSNQFSGAIAALYKDLLDDQQVVNPLPPTVSGDFSDELLDRFAASLPWPKADLRAHELHKYHPSAGCAVCNRMTVFYGREWVHDNLDDFTHEKLHGLVGPAGIEVFRQLYFLVLRKRLTDRHGANVYLTEPNVRRHWTFPVLFCHGRQNKVFDARSAVRSWHRLWRVQRRATAMMDARPVRLFVHDDYGHMDFLFGKDAHREIYPQLLKFFEKPAAFRSTWSRGKFLVEAEEPSPDHANAKIDADLRDHNYVVPRRLLTGPLIQIESAAGKPSELVLWFEQRLDTTSDAVAPKLVAGKEELPQGVWDPIRLREIHSDGAKAVTTHNVTLRSAGIYWVGRLREGAKLTFATMPPLELSVGAGESQTPHISALVGADDTYSGDVDLANPVTFGNLGSPIPDNTWVQKPERQPTVRGWLAGLFGRLRPSPPPSPPPRDDVAYDDESGCTLDLANLPWWKRWVGTLPPTPVSWLATSCRWPGTPFERDAADALAILMLAHVEHARRPVDALVLLGDQIYADATADVADTTEAEERGPQRYRDAWGFKTQTSKLLARVPTYLVIDDHEYRDGWTGEERNPGSNPEFVASFESTFAYQWRWDSEKQHRPGIFAGGIRGFWKEFSIGGIPAFAADTRSERGPRDAPNWTDARMLSEPQFKALEAWLLAHRDVPKVLCTGSVFGMPERRLLAEPELCRVSDSWMGFPRAWQRLAGFIARNGIRHVIFLSGDYHLSAVAELEIRAVGAAAPVRAVSVVASGWNATLPFANAQRRDYVEGRPVACPLGHPDVELWSTAAVMSTEFRQFSKLTLERTASGWALAVSVLGQGLDGSEKLLGAKTLQL